MHKLRREIDISEMVVTNSVGQISILSKITIAREPEHSERDEYTPN